MILFAKKDGAMTKEEMIKWLNGIVGNNNCPLESRIKAADLLAAIEGWKVSHNYCKKVQPRGMGPR